MILVDYLCPQCAGTIERRVMSPPPAELPCPACGTLARRLFSPVRLGGTAPPPHDPAPPQRAPECQDNPGIPGICHMEPSAARAWAARARGDSRALDQELARQERALSAAPDLVISPVHHHHERSHHEHPASTAGREAP